MHRQQGLWSVCAWYIGEFPYFWNQPSCALEKKLKKKEKTKKYRLLRIFGRIFIGIIVFLILLILFIRSPWGQNIIVQRAVKYVSNKTHTKVEIEKLFITFDGNVMLKGLFLEDKKGDTLVYSKSLEADIPLLPIIRGNGFGIDYLQWEGLRANILRKDSIAGYNFQFLIDAFSAPDAPPVTKDTTAAPIKIVLGEIDLKDFNITFNDEVLGIDSQFQIEKLVLHMKKTDLEHMDFRASKVAITNSRIKFIQTPVPPDPNPEPAPLPYLQLDKLTLKNIFVDYQSLEDRIAANLELSELNLELNKADLANNDIDIGNFRLKNSIIFLNTETENNIIVQKADEVTEEVKEDIQKFEWPDFKIAVSQIDLEGNKFSYVVGNSTPKKNSFNPNVIVLENLRLNAKEIFLKEKKAGLQLDALSFEESSGLNLKEMALNLQLTDHDLNVNDLILKLNNNTLKGRVEMQYNSLARLIEKPDNSKINLHIPAYFIDLKDVYRFQPELRKNEYFRKLSNKTLAGNLSASGYLSAISIPDLKVRWGNTTQISAAGVVKNVTEPNNLAFNIPRFSAETTRADLTQFVSEKDLGVTLPANVALKGNAKGNIQDIYAQANLTTTHGIATIDGHFKNDGDIAFEADLQIEKYQLGELMNNPQLGAISLTLKTAGSGDNINNLNAVLDANISSFKFNDYTITDLPIKGKIKDGEGEVISHYKDRNINLDLTAEVVLDSVSPTMSAYLHLLGANLQSLGFMDRDVRIGMKFDADFEGSKDGYDVISTIGEAVVVYDDRTYLLGDVLATAHVRSDTTSIWIDNKILQLSLESNSDPETFAKAVNRHIGSYFSRRTELPDSIMHPVKLDVKGRIAQAPVLNKVFLMNVKDLDTITMAVNFNERARRLKAAIYAPHINYNGYTMDSLAFTMNTDKEKFDFDLGFNNIKAGPLNVPKTKVTGEQKNNELHLAFTAVHKDSTLININSEITGTAEELRFHVLPEDLILDRKIWETPENNEILISKDKIVFNDFRFTRNDEVVAFTDKLSGISLDHAAIEFENFKLSEILNYLNPEEEIAKGNLNGNLAVVEPFGHAGLMAGLVIENLNVLQVDLGKMTVDAEPLGGNSYDFNLALKEGDVDLDLVGNYVATGKDANLDLKLDINEFKMRALEGFSLGEIKNGNGGFQGKFTVSGSTKNPVYSGNINFTNADFTITKLNAPFSLVNENVKIDNQGLYMENFTIRDENKNRLQLTGKIGTETFINPTFDLSLKADNFRVLNASEEDNEFLYGKVAFNADARLTGDLQIPKVSAQVSITDDTDFTYVLPSASVAIEERDGIVIFVNRENPDAILTRTSEKSATFTGVDVNAFIKIGKKAKVTILIDKETGDNFEVFGDGEFNFTMSPNGRMTLSGMYDIAGGHYEMNLYNLVNRRFDLAPGSRVSWSGDPLDASLDVKALYKVEASASPLMAPVSSGADPSVKNKYRQVLPFYVYLNVDGELTKPVISFDLDMPEDNQGAIGGQVYGRLQQINKQEDELNRQVFSLLVLNRFYPEPGSDGSGGGFATVARDNLNDALSDQLNTFSNKLLGDTGVELDFGLDSYTDYQGETPQERTQLDIAAQKKLFNDRLIVRVGSEVDLQGSSSTNEPTPLIGNISLEYLLTENGRYRLKGFSKNEFENVIDGQTIVSGIALIFTQEFNKFDELWQAILRGETKEEKEMRKAAKEKQKEREEEEQREAQSKKIDPERE